MINFSYNFSTELKQTLSKIESLRQKILLAPLSAKMELRLRWKAMVNRVYWAMVFSKGRSINKSQVVKLLTKEANPQNKEEHKVLKYKNALDYIRGCWLVSKESVTPKTILTLHDLACRGTLRSSEAVLKQLLDYLQRSPEHPIIQAAIAYNQIINIAPFGVGNTQVASLLALLFLYKAGYDFRGLLVLEECWHPDLIIYRGNLTPLLEDFSKVLVNQLEKTRNFNLESQAELGGGLSASFWEFNDRQKAILLYLEQPNISITNKKVQSLFKVSQITASRDLTRLVTLGLLFTHGGGRSVYYTKA